MIHCTTLLAALPYWFRLQQCIRRFYDAGSGSPQRTAHLLNAGKYATSLLATLCAALGNYSQLNFSEISEWEWGKVVWFSVLCFGTAYAYIWDITMDWGFVERNPDGPWWCPYQLRRERIYPYKSLYYLAAVLNLMGRLAWALTITPHSLFTGVPRGVTTTIIAVVEILRRAQWSLFRLEYEYTNNPFGYRSVKEVPMMLNTEGYQDENEKEKKKAMSISSLVVIIVNTMVTAVILMALYWYRNHNEGPLPTPSPSA